MNRWRKALLRTQMNPIFQTAVRLYDEEAANRLMAFFKAESKGEKAAAMSHLLLESIRLIGARSREEVVEGLNLTIKEDLGYMQVRALFNAQEMTTSNVYLCGIYVLTNPSFPGVYLIRREDGEYDEDVVAVTDDAAYQRVIDALFGARWAKGNHLTLGHSEKAPTDVPAPAHESSSTRYPLFLTPPAGRYLGSPDPADTATDLAEGETILLIGASGCGKTTFARRLADHLPFVTTTLTVTGNYAADAMKVVQFLRPDMLIVDDIPLSHGVNNDLLALLENCHQFVKIVVLTFMADEPAEQFLRPGGLYWPGMRPGRIDRIFVMNRPDKDQRQAILRSYLPTASDDLIDKMSEKTEGMTGAYLKTLAADVTRLGEGCWERRLEYLIYQMPSTDRY